VRQRTQSSLRAGHESARQRLLLLLLLLLLPVTAPVDATLPRAQGVTSAQLSTLHLAARPGLRAPTLRQFLAALRACGCRRPLVVEVKALQTDGGREQLLRLLR
jgi:hypothetical protein